MIATIRKLDCWGREIWRLSATHGVDLSMDLDTRDEAEVIAVSACNRASAWPLSIDVIFKPNIQRAREIVASKIFGSLKEWESTRESAPSPTFTLTPEPAQRPPRAAAIANNERKQQRVLLAGLDCLPGQNDLFETDGGN